MPPSCKSAANRRGLALSVGLWMVSAEFLGALALCVRSGNTGRVITLTEPQVWTLIGVFSTVLFAVFATMSGYMVRTMNAGFDRVDAKIDDLRAEMNARFELVDVKFELVDVKFERINDRFDHLDRDMQAIRKRVFPDV